MGAEPEILEVTVDGGVSGTIGQPFDEYNGLPWRYGGNAANSHGAPKGVGVVIDFPAGDVLRRRAGISELEPVGVVGVGGTAAAGINFGDDDGGMSNSGKREECARREKERTHCD